MILYMRLSRTIANIATGIFYNIFSLLTLISALTQSNNVTLYKLLI